MPMQNFGDVMKTINSIRTSKNPMQILMNMAPQNNSLNQAMQLVNGKTPFQMQQIAMNLAKQRGVDLGQMMQQLGFK